MVARTPQSKDRRRAAPPLSPSVVRETVKKVERCVARLQELQSTVAGVDKPLKSSSPGKGGEWRSLSLPAMLLGETVTEIMEASGFARRVDGGKEMRAKRAREKTYPAKSPPVRSARARITFKPAVSANDKFLKAGSPVVCKGQRHRFMVKSPAAAAAAAAAAARSKAAAPARQRRSFSPARLATRLVSMSPLRTRSSKREAATPAAA
ncbi:cyclin family [Wolffia australiana]